jgi:predicted acylesterase/phospholipase RssA
VNVSPSEEKAWSYQDKAGISGWQILWSRLNPFVKRIETPSLVANIMRSLEINSVHQIKNKQRLADVLIQPDVGQFGMLDFSSYQSISEAGYLTSREELARWLENQR